MHQNSSSPPLTQERPGYILYTKTATRRRGSIGILVKYSWKENIKSFKGYSDRLCSLVLKFKEGLFGFIQAYAPTSTASDSEMQQFYNLLSQATNDLSKCNWLVVMWDFNAKIGQSTDHDDDVMGKIEFGVRNDRGEKLIQFARNQKLSITNTIFQKRDRRRHTWSLGVSQNQIDWLWSAMIWKN